MVWQDQFNNRCSGQNITTEKHYISEITRFKVVYNLSDYHLKRTATEVLVKWFHFATAPARILVENIISHLESRIRRIEDSKVQESIQQYMYIYIVTITKPPKINISYDQFQSVNALKNHGHIIIWRTEKRNATIWVCYDQAYIKTSNLVKN